VLFLKVASFSGEEKKVPLLLIMLGASSHCIKLQDHHLLYAYGVYEMECFAHHNTSVVVAHSSSPFELKLVMIWTMAGFPSCSFQNPSFGFL
jgi:hypothetical protein